MAGKEERQGLILDRLASDGTLSVTALSEELGVSEVTIREDLRSLELQGVLVRTRGGARAATAPHILQRQRVNVEAKERIAAAAAALVSDGDTVMIEAGTTTALIPRWLTRRRGVQIVTNSTLVFTNARANPALSIILAGGVFRPELEATVGPQAERGISDFNPRIAFLGTDGFSPERGLTTHLLEGGQIATRMHEQAEETWLVADSTKFGRAGFVSFLRLEDIAGIITDSGISSEALESLSEHTQVRVV